MKDFRTFLQEYEAAYPNMVAHVEGEVSSRWEAAGVALKAQKELREAPLLIFHRVRTEDGNVSPYPLVVNVFASRQRSAFATGCSFDRLGCELYDRKSARRTPVVVSREDAPVKEVVAKGNDVDLRDLPAIVHAAWDPGPYVSAGFLTTYDPESGVDNTALQRGWLFGPREIRVFPNKSSHNAWNIKKWEDRGEDARVAFWVGHHPAVCMGAETKLGYPEGHWAAAGGLIDEPLRLVPSETLGDEFLVPADAEFVIEGIIPRGELKPEGPFGEFTRYFGGQRLNPYMKVTCVTHRRDPYWFTIVTGYGDDGIGALRREGATYELLKRVVPQVMNVYRPPSCPFYMYVQLKKTADWQPRACIAAALAVPDAIKNIFVFDDDVDIFDEAEVHWAVGTRSDWAKDMIVVPNLNATTLDPTSHDGLGTRAGIDCTKPAPPGVYEQRSFIPESVMAEIHLEDYLRDKARA